MWLGSSKSQRPTTHCRLPAATLEVLWTWEDQAAAPSQRSLYQKVKKFRKSEHMSTVSQMEQLLWLSVVWAGAGLSGPLLRLGAFCRCIPSWHPGVIRPECCCWCRWIVLWRGDRSAQTAAISQLCNEAAATGSGRFNGLCTATYEETVNGFAAQVGADGGIGSGPLAKLAAEH